MGPAPLRIRMDIVERRLDEHDSMKEILLAIDLRTTQLAAQIPLLRREMTESFSAVRQDIARVEERLDRVEERLTCVEGRLDRVEERLTRVEERLDRVEERLTRVEGRLDRVEQRLAVVEQRLTRVEERLDPSGGKIH